ncbi:dolichyl-diphosphooligosaccharide--protein glycosyltransferase subunit 1 [Saccoglossus kowalevskii]|uniref:Dolichyl-diphosphooligosaccharide--protein glycosyltransferase subunit 1 n=1 Tax=Saccoglossus kowalevskii TaxID=10224 RepID=A0ABM0GYL0_SACKO|nr:PREDICTED: dolichyl-diphosphooligosaccharide--protein glycosyltransferase subunit 1 [Saccoglossus kowalevskii]
MYRTFLQLTVCICLLSLSTSAKQGSVNNDLIIMKAERTLDMASQLVKQTTAINLINNANAPVKSFLLATEPLLANNLAFVGATIKSDDETEHLDVEAVKVAGHSDIQFYSVSLEDPLGAGQSLDVNVEEIFTHVLRAFPSQISQDEKQLVEFTSNYYFYSPYPVSEQTTNVKLSSSNVESYSKLSPVSASDDTITYGPYERIRPFSKGKDNLKVHYENNSPFLTVTQLERVIEISHWGNIAVEETLDIRHTGAKLKGSFSRYDYQRTQDGFSSIKSFKTILPASARDVYYRDEIGNISTSHLNEQDEFIEVELRPRFPLFGGWKSHYYIGYNVPTYEYLFNSGDAYVLQMRFLDHIFDDQVVDELTVKIILPEGCKDIEFRPPYSVRQDSIQRHYTYLDTMGRPVLVAHKSNLVEPHIQDFELHYTFQKILLLQEPLLVVGAFYLLFLVVIIYVRLDFTISKDPATESRLRIAGLIEQVLKSEDKRFNLYHSYDEAINKFKSSKNSSALNDAKKKLDQEFRGFTTNINAYLSSLKQEVTDASDKVAEIQKLEAQMKELVAQAVQHAEKIVSGKFSKSQYVEAEKQNMAAREAVGNKLGAIINALQQ